MRAKIKSDKKFYSLKENITKLADQLKEEKSKSRVAIAKLMEDAEVHVKEAHDLSLAIAHSKKDFEHQKAASKEKEREAVQEERSWSARLFGKCK